MIAAALHQRLRSAAVLPAALDQPLLLTVAALATLGLMMVASASVSFAFHDHGDAFYFVKRHVIYLIMAVGVGALVLRVPVRKLYQYRWHLVATTLLLLLAVLIPGIGREVNGARRWIGLGFLNFQVAELAKLVAILYISSYLQRHQFAMRETWHSFLRPLCVIVLMVFLILMQPDFGSSVVIMATVMGLFFLAGVRLWIFGGMVALAASALALLAVTSPYRMKRLVSFMDPWSDQFNSGYQLVQSLIAFGRGEWFGVGLGNSVQKLFYLPEAHTDFVFAIFAEEMGMFGVVAVIGLFIFLVHRIFGIARLAVQRQDWFAAYVVFGIGMLMAGQSFINVGVTSGLLPTKGLTLPFVSYGGSSLIICSCMIAIVLRVGVEMKDPAWTSGRNADGQ